MHRSPRLVAAFLLIAGCTILGPVKSEDRFFTLTAVAGPSAAPDTSGIVYGLGPVRIPAYLDRNEIVTRVSPTEVRYSSSDRWAEQLPVNVAAVLRQDLSSQLGTSRIVVYPWSTEAPVTYQIEVTLNRLDVDLTGQGQLLAQWAIRDGQQQRYLMLRETALTSAGQPHDTTAAVAAMSTLLGELSAEIATAMRTLPPPAAAPAKAGSR